MLTELRIKNLAVVDDAVLEPGAGLNVISGETGAGKSILVGAVELLFGGRGGPDLIRTGADALRVEGLFHFDDPLFLKRRGVDVGLPDGTLLLVREIARNGRSRVLVNDELATVGRLKAIGDVLADLHGQHEHQTLLRAETHVDYLDRFGDAAVSAAPARPETARPGDAVGRAGPARLDAGGPGDAPGSASPTHLDAYRFARLAWLELRERFAELSARHGSADERRDRLTRDAAEIEAAALKPGEDETLRTERGLLVHAEKLSEAVRDGAAELTDSDNAADVRLGRAAKRVAHAAGLDPALEPVVKQIEDARVLVQEAAFRLARYGDHLHFEPDRAETIENRLALIARLRKKYGGDETSIAERGRALRAELGGMEDEAAALESLAKEIARAEAAARAAGETLRAWRREAAGRLEKGMSLELSALGMPRARVHVRMEPLAGDGGAAAGQGGAAAGHGGAAAGRAGAAAGHDDATAGDGGAAAGHDRATALGEKGLDRIEFFLEANPGEEPRALSRVASGGELSRIMLAMKAVLRSADPLPILVFDEVDAGIGGRVATEVGTRLHEIADGRQVFVVTHLPMIACQADQHFRVEKSIERGRTVTRVTPLAGREREQELARMLAGAAAQGSEALRAARALLAEARKGSR